MFNTLFDRKLHVQSEALRLYSLNDMAPCSDDAFETNRGKRFVVVIRSKIIVLNCVFLLYLNIYFMYLCGTVAKVSALPKK